MNKTSFKTLLLAVGLVAFLACQNKPETQSAENASEKAEIENTVTAKAAVNTSDKDFDLVLNYDRADRHEYIKVKFLSAAQIRYEVYLSSGDCPETIISGTAGLVEGDMSAEDVEKRTDDVYEDGTSSPCNVRIFLEKAKKTKKGRFELDVCHHFACGENYQSENMTAY
jgi:hypothetical protein